MNIDPLSRKREKFITEIIARTKDNETSIIESLAWFLEENNLTFSEIKSCIPSNIMIQIKNEALSLKLVDKNFKYDFEEHLSSKQMF